MKILDRCRVGLALVGLLCLHRLVAASDFSIVNGRPPSCEGDERPISDAQVRSWGAERAAPRAVLAALSSHLPGAQLLRSVSLGAQGMTVLVEAGPADLPGERTRLQAALKRSGLLRGQGGGAGLDIAPGDPSLLTLHADRDGLDVQPLAGRAAGCRELDAVIISLTELSAAWLPSHWRWLSREAFVDDGPARSLQLRFAAQLSWSQLQEVLLNIEQAPYQLRLAEFSVSAQGAVLEVAGTLRVPFGKTSNAVRDAGFLPRKPLPTASAPQRNPFARAEDDPAHAGGDCERRARLWASTRPRLQFLFASGPDEKPVAMISMGQGMPLRVSRGDKIGETGATLLRVGSHSADVDIEYAEMTASASPACVLKRITLSDERP
ncbi:MAG TPA: hypothetical protein VIN03_23530 [Roseateles sp.]